MKISAQDPAHGDVRDELDRILASEEFDASDRNRRFLSFIVGEVLAGRGDRIKAYTIATSVFGRDANFDPQLDSIVRIEAGRLRRSLERYYLTAGTGDQVTISIPKGSYAPVFRARTTDDHASAHIRTDERGGGPRRSGRTIFVRTFEQDGDGDRCPGLARWFTRQLIAGLTRFADVVVYGPETALPSDGADCLERLRADHGVDFILTGGITVSGERLSIEALLVETGSGRYVWADDHHRTIDPTGPVELDDDVANAIVCTLAQPYGVLSSAASMLANGGSCLTGAECAALYYRYARTYDASRFAGAFAAIRAAAESTPEDAEVLACLSRLWVDVHRYGYDPGVSEPDPLGTALDLARRAIALAPNSSRGHVALGLAYWLSGDVDGSFAAFGTALALNPNDTEALVELGFRHALRTEWDVGIPMLESAYRRNPAQPGPYRLGLGLWHLAHGRHEAALAEARKTEMSHLPHGFLVAAAAATRLGLSEEAVAALDNVARTAPELTAAPAAWLAARNVHPSLVDILVRGLSDAELVRSPTGRGRVDVGAAA